MAPCQRSSVAIIRAVLLVTSRVLYLVIHFLVRVRNPGMQTSRLENRPTIIQYYVLKNCTCLHIMKISVCVQPSYDTIIQLICSLRFILITGTCFNLFTLTFFTRFSKNLRFPVAINIKLLFL